MDAVPDITNALMKLGIRQDGDEVLRRTTVPVVFGRDDVAGIANELRTRLLAIAKLYDFRNGLGLAAPQIGIAKSVCIFGEATDALFTFVNPSVSKSSSDRSDGYEGCLSCWSKRGIVSRPNLITLTGYDEGGQVQTMQLTGVLARVAQHECDHLQGMLYLDRMTRGAPTIGLEEYSRVRRR